MIAMGVDRMPTTPVASRRWPLRVLEVSLMRYVETDSARTTSDGGGPKGVLLDFRNRSQCL
jgi:hypothetical protein